MEDCRVQKTREAIRASLLELLGEKGLTSYIEQRRDEFLLLAHAEGARSLQRLTALFAQSVTRETRRLNPAGSEAYDEVEAVFVVCGMVGVLEQWLSAGMQASRADLSLMLARILRKVNAV